MEIDDQMIDKISRLAYLEFGAAEKEKIRKDLELCRIRSATRPWRPDSPAS